MKSKIIYLLLVVLLISTVACKKADLSTDKGKYSYAIGYNIGSSLKKDNVELDTDSFMAAIEDALNGKESGLTPEQAQQAIMNLRISMQTKRAQGAEENKK
ncbi:MAG TPA: FKBP-type peptidyl-prolyl cis-trans isomerase N-terminal domain-containing protein, partial [Spirochaetota bacterium]|nr:FKBP-type peptidyl-prolyl cis-trans isomerase N-terminal domain-containing protein [Spirochaetota bacterium]